MREHLYKAKTLDTSDWVFGNVFGKSPPLTCFEEYIQEKSEWFILQTGFADWNMPRPIEFIKVDPDTICEYTGWVFNGEKAFEGDTVTNDYGNGVIRFGEHRVFDDESNGDITYPTIGFFIQYDDGETTLPDVDNLDYFTVTGNIHDTGLCSAD